MIDKHDSSCTARPVASKCKRILAYTTMEIDNVGSPLKWSGSFYTAPSSSFVLTAEAIIISISGQASLLLHDRLLLT